MACGGIGGAIKMAPLAVPGYDRLSYMHSRLININCGQNYMCLITVNKASYLVTLIMAATIFGGVTLCPALMLTFGPSTCLGGTNLDAGIRRMHIQKSLNGF